MNTLLSDVLTNLFAQLPTLLVCLIGVYLSFERREQNPRSASLAMWGFALFLSTNLAVGFLNNWLINSMNQPDADFQFYQSLFSAIGFATRLLIALSLALLLRAIFPPLPGYVGPGWVRYLIGIVIGLLLGGALGALLGDPIGGALGISNFEGGRGYFVAFIVIPAAAILGAIIGAVTARMTGAKTA